MSKERLVSIFLKYAYLPDYSFDASSIKKALKHVNKTYKEREKKYKSGKAMIRHYYDVKGNILIRNDYNYDLLDFWDAYSPFHTQDAPISPTLLEHIYDLQVMNKAVALEKDFYFGNRAADTPVH